MTRHVVVIPARNEAEFIGEMLESLLAQSERADRIIVVDDGSTDRTAAIVEKLAERDSSVVLVHRGKKGDRAMGARVVQAFNAGYEFCRGEPILYVSKLDADLRLPPYYFEELLRFLDHNPRVAAAGGALYDRRGNQTVRLRVPPNHVVGALKTIRRSVFDAMGGFLPVSGWDIIDLVKIRSLGHETALLEDLRVIHLRPHGGAQGELAAKRHWGHGAWVIGSHPLFVLGRGFYRMLEPPYALGGLALWWGYLSAALKGVQQIPDHELIAALRREQLSRLLHGNKIAAVARPEAPQVPVAVKSEEKAEHGSLGAIVQKRARAARPGSVKVETVTHDVTASPVAATPVSVSHRRRGRRPRE